MLSILNGEKVHQKMLKRISIEMVNNGSVREIKYLIKQGAVLS